MFLGFQPLSRRDFQTDTKLPLVSDGGCPLALKNISTLGIETLGLKIRTALLPRGRNGLKIEAPAMDLIVFQANIFLPLFTAVYQHKTHCLSSMVT